jgi:diaminopimelate epimerase
MDGAGNRFVIVDLRAGGEINAEAARYLGDRMGPFGCDQIITLENDRGNARMGILNADGSSAGQCGNASRCVAVLLRDGSETRVRFLSPAGPLEARFLPGGDVEVDMGPPRLGWRDIPLAEEVEDTAALPLPPELLRSFGLEAPVGVSMGNPHAVFFVDDAERAALETFGPIFEHHPLFPDRANISAASLREEGLRLRTWERGVGITLACGTAACAALVAGVRRGLTGRAAAVHADGGKLAIRWDEITGHVHMAGPTRLHRQGVFGQE